MQSSKQKEFMSLYEPIHENFVRFCSARSYGIMETEDLVQESLAAAFHKFDKIKEKKAFLSYLMRTASNLLVSQLRRKKFKGDYKEEAFEQLKSLTQDPSLALDIDYLYTQMKKLPKTTYEALILFEISGFAIKEIAEIQESSVSAVKVRLHRGREKLTALCQEPNHSESKVNIQVLASFLF